MKPHYLLLIIFISSFYFSCNKKDFGNINTVEATTVFSDSLSIHAITPVSENKVWFAGSRGKMGLIDGDIPKLAIIKYDDKLLHFRSLAVTDEAVYVLSIASPAVLYKIGYNENEATNIENVYTESGEKVFYNSMKFWNNKEGIAMGDPIDNCLTVIITRDGGNSWQKIDCDLLPEADRGEVAFAASNSNIALVGDNVWIATGGTRARVFHSADKGKSWKVYDTPVMSGEAMSGIHSISFWDNKNGIVAGGNSKKEEDMEANVAITSDGGKTWELSGHDIPEYISSVKYLPNGEGKAIMALGPKGIWYTKNRGKSWKKISNEEFFVLEFVNDTLAFAAGKNRIARLVFKK